jgi:hypothetical protein
MRLAFAKGRIFYGNTPFAFSGSRARMAPARKKARVKGVIALSAQR